MTESAAMKNMAYVTVGVAKLTEDGKLGVNLAIVNTDTSAASHVLSPDDAEWISRQLLAMAAYLRQQPDALMLINGKLENLEARCDVIQNLILARVPPAPSKVSRRRAKRE